MSLAQSVSSRLKGKSADRWSAMGVCQKSKDPTHQPQTAQPKPTKPNQPEPNQAHSLSACRTTGRPREGGDENMEQPYRPIRRGRAVLQEYARTRKTSNQTKNHPTKTNQQPNNPTNQTNNRPAHEGNANSFCPQWDAALRRQGAEEKAAYGSAVEKTRHSAVSLNREQRLAGG